MSDIYTHTTSLENLTRMLDGSRHIMALRHLARTSPDTEVSVEPLPMPIRRRMKAGDAYERMRGVKDTDRVFLSHRGWLPNYGDAVVVKRLSPRSVVRGERLNSIPEEYTTGRALSLRSNADVYVPDEVLEEFRAKYPSIRFRGRSTLHLRAYGLSDRIATLKDKLMERAGFGKTASENDVARADARFRRMFGRNARMVGSEALGINVPGSSDIDVFVPYRRESAYRRALERLPRKYPSLVMNKASLHRDEKKTLTGKVNGQDMDVVLAYGPKAENFRKAFAAARDRLTDTDRRKIINRKRALKDSWFFPGLRYNLYKKQLAEELGLRNAYF
ncbi:hypothetical protein [Desulfovibrio piger]|nr:hypothetical protein [Desulfovibrio piger]MBM6836428.1 hypothetical protein [Desulfovibrio piger]